MKYSLSIQRIDCTFPSSSAPSAYLLVGWSKKQKGHWLVQALLNNVQKTAIRAVFSAQIQNRAPCMLL